MAMAFKMATTGMRVTEECTSSFMEMKWKKVHNTSFTRSKRILVKSPSIKLAAPEKATTISPLLYRWMTVATQSSILTLLRSITAVRARSSSFTGRRRRRE